MRGVEDKNFSKGTESHIARTEDRSEPIRPEYTTTRYAGTAGMRIPQMSLGQLHTRNVEFSHQGQSQAH